MAKMCIFDDKKVCDNCGDCIYCDIYPNKICDNCGDCLKEDYDSKAIKIDGILNDNDELSDYNYSIESKNDNMKDNNNDDCMHIDDIKNLDKIVDEVEESDDKENDKAYEKYPGLIVIKHDKNKK